MAIFRRYGQNYFYKYVWVWELPAHEDDGWFRAGGIWPLLRVVRRLRHTDIYEHIEL